MTPTIGRIVLYRSRLGLGYLVPAIVTRTVASTVEHANMPTELLGLSSDDHVDLRVFGTVKDYREFNVPMGEGEGEWRWPPRSAG